MIKNIYLTWLWIVLGLWNLVGCGLVNQDYALNVVEVGSTVSSLRNKYQNLRLVINARQETDPVFSEEEWGELESFDTIVQLIIQKMDIQLQVHSGSVDTQDMYFIWGMAKESYTRVRVIILNHLNDFDKETQAMFYIFDDRIKSLGKEVDELLANPTTSNINQAFTLIAGILETGFKILALIP